MHDNKHLSLKFLILSGNLTLYREIRDNFVNSLLKCHAFFINVFFQNNAKYHNYVSLLLKHNDLREYEFFTGTYVLS